eukprot:CAMPEP_0119160252 /NCGR_PEP_ID=MMETSP1315-20130426/223_1 /TAXON_ID=676789 /ORGANISM="Prasinoderma singularis, Strain RCC927" /LENGTH=176 /DNA_ID=CAMNT_0007152899 /DNA_START=40 /DNA_END=568 /DNA_ORIENTATION=-
MTFATRLRGLTTSKSLLVHGRRKRAASSEPETKKHWPSADSLRYSTRGAPSSRSALLSMARTARPRAPAALCAVDLTLVLVNAHVDRLLDAHAHPILRVVVVVVCLALASQDEEGRHRAQHPAELLRNAHDARRRRRAAPREAHRRRGAKGQHGPHGRRAPAQLLCARARRAHARP